MEAKDLSCWKCGASLDGVPMPLSRLSECLSCRAELHVCRLCEFYDTTVAQACREPLAEEVKDKTRANFCEHFYPRPDAYAGAHAGAGASNQTPSSELAALFGDGPAADPPDPAAGTEQHEQSEPPVRNPLDDLFRKP